MGRISLETTAPAQPIHLTCNPFLLENLVWLCLELAIAATGSGRTLTLTPEKTASAIRLQIAGIDGLGETSATRNAAGIEAILAALGAEMTTDPAGHTLTLSLA